MIFPFSLKEREIEMKKRVYTLYRVSTKGQVEKDDIPMQKEACRNFAESQGWEIVKEFSEKGVSGFKKSAKERDELQKIQQAAMEGKFDILLVFMFDRLGRRDDETPFIVEWFTKQGIEVWSVNEGQQRFDTHVDKLMNYIRYWQASGESLKTSVRTRTRLEQLTGEGHYTGGTVAFGYKRVRLGRVNKKNQEVCDLVIDEAEAEIVRLIFHKYVYEGYGAQKLSHYLYEQGVVGRNNKNIPNTSIVRMIKNKGYTGYLINGAVETECPQLRIIEPELFEQAQELRQARTCERGGTSLGTSSKALLTGLVYCAHCGNRLSLTSSGRTHTYADGHTVKEVRPRYALLQKSYKLKIFNTINFSKSMKYNPMAYIHSEKDILKLVTALMTNTKGEGQGGDPFWDKAERLLLVSLIAYLHYEAPVEEQNFATLLEMLNTMQVSEDDETYQNPVDLLFEDLGKKKPKSFAVRQYKLYKLAAGKTAKSILISCGARLAPFDIQEVRDATMYDELELDKLGDRKTALFLIMSDTDSTFNFLISMIYTQLFNLLCDKADDQYGGKLPVHVQCLIDECANIGQIPQLEKLVATIRSREISACLVLQTRSQLKAIYKDNADTIVGNMDSQIFLGGSEPTTLKDLAEALGKETIDSYNNSDTRGNSPSYGTNYQKLGHELMSRDELAVLDGGKCILQLRGVRPFLSDKYDLTQHPNYKYTSDYDPKNALDIEKFLNRKEKIHPDDTFVMVDADSLPPA